MASAGEPFFHSMLEASSSGRRFCLWHAPQGSTRKGLVIHVHAFAEEMNKSRRMVALQARALADTGFAVLQMDLLGCGDSEGEFAEATWDLWMADVVAACHFGMDRWNATFPGAAPAQRWLWGHRAGALLAVQAADALRDTHWKLLLWQPTPNGNNVLQQFLRLDGAAALLGKADASQPSAKRRLEAGASIEVGGYVLNPGLARGLGAARLDPPAKTATVVWLDVSRAPIEAPTPAVLAVLDSWQRAGWSVVHRKVHGPSFWQTTEIEEASELIAATTQAVLAFSAPNLSAHSASATAGA